MVTRAVHRVFKDRLPRNVSQSEIIHFMPGSERTLLILLKLLRLSGSQGKPGPHPSPPWSPTPSPLDFVQVAPTGLSQEGEDCYHSVEYESTSVFLSAGCRFGYSLVLLFFGPSQGVVQGPRKAQLAPQLCSPGEPFLTSLPQSF